MKQEIKENIKRLNKLGEKLYSKFGTDSYEERCELWDIRANLKSLSKDRLPVDDEQKESKFDFTITEEKELGAGFYMDEHSITFGFGEKEYLNISSNGAFSVNGTVVKVDEEVYHKFKAWIDKATSKHSQTVVKSVSDEEIEAEILKRHSACMITKSKHLSKETLSKGMDAFREGAKFVNQWMQENNTNKN